MKRVDSITVAELSEMAAKMYGGLVKGVADVKKGIVVLDAEMHADEEQFLLANGSSQDSLWGFNLYPGKFGTSGFIEFDSMINIRPRQQNMDRGIGNKKIRDQIVALINKKVKQ